MKLRRTLITAIIAVAAASLAATGSAGPITTSPSATKIAYFTYDARDNGFDVMLMNSTATGAVNLTHDGTAMKNVDPNFSPNGLKIAFTKYNALGGADIFAVNATGKGLVNLTGGPALLSRTVNIHPTWAPDGSIVFASNRDGNFDLYRIGVPSVTNSIVRMTKTEAPVQNLDPDYSANGKMLVFSRTASLSVLPMGASLLSMVAVPGAIPTKVTQGVAGLGDRGAAWSPDGRQIAFYSDRAGNNDLYVIGRDGSGMRKLTSSTASDREPTWSPDGYGLAFLSDRTGSTELWAMSTIGLSIGDPPAWQLTFDKLVKGAPDWQPASPVSTPPRVPTLMP
jgi:TolB protein